MTKRPYILPHRWVGDIILFSHDPGRMVKPTWKRSVNYRLDRARVLTTAADVFFVLDLLHRSATGLRGLNGTLSTVLCNDLIVFFSYIFIYFFYIFYALVLSTFKYIFLCNSPFCLIPTSYQIMVHVVVHIHSHSHASNIIHTTDGRGIK